LVGRGVHLLPNQAPSLMLLSPSQMKAAIKAVIPTNLAEAGTDKNLAKRAKRISRISKRAKLLSPEEN
jgi:hypothetical protein